MKRGCSLARAQCRNVTLLTLNNGSRITKSSVSTSSLKLYKNKSYILYSYPQISTHNSRYYATTNANDSEKIYLQSKKKIADLEKQVTKYVQQEDWEKAEDSIKMIFGMNGQFKILEENKLLGKTLLNLAFVEQTRGKIEQSLRSYAKAIEILTQEKGAGHYEVGTAILNYAEALSQDDSLLPKAEAECIKAIQILQKHYGESEFMGAAYANLGGYLAKQKKFEEAKPHLFNALKIFEKKLGKKNEYAQSAYSNCAKVLADLGQTEELEKFKEEWRDFVPVVDQDNQITQLPGGIPQEELEKFTNTMEEKLRNYSEKNIDPLGYMKDAAVSRSQLKYFMDRFSGQVGLDPGILKSFVEQVRSSNNSSLKDTTELYKKKMGLRRKGTKEINFKDIAVPLNEDLEAGELSDKQLFALLKEANLNDDVYAQLMQQHNEQAEPENKI